MNKKTSDLQKELDEKLQKAREANGIKTVPYNYDTTIEIEEVEKIANEASPEKVSENADALISNAPKTTNTNEKENTSVEATTLNTNSTPNIGVKNNDKEENER